MAKKLPELLLQLVLDPSKFNEEAHKLVVDLDTRTERDEKAHRKTRGIADQLSGLLSGFGIKTLGVLAALGFAADKIAGFTKRVLEANVDMNTMSRSLGINVDQLAGWVQAAKEIGGTRQGTLQTFANITQQLERFKTHQEFGGLTTFMSALGINLGDVKNATDAVYKIAAALKTTGLTKGQIRALAEPAGFDPAFLEMLMKYTDAIEQHVEDAKTRAGYLPKEMREGGLVYEAWVRMEQHFDNLGRVILTRLTPFVEGMYGVFLVLKKALTWIRDRFKLPDWAKTIMLYGLRGFALGEALYQLWKRGEAEMGQGGGTGGGAGENRVSGGARGALPGDVVHGYKVAEPPSRAGRFDPVTGTSIGGGVGGYSASMGPGAHEGVDIMAPRGSALYASMDGRVVRIGRDNFGQQTITLQHSDGTYTRYLHVIPGVSEGDVVKGGQKIGASGSANGSDHLHYEMWKGAPGQQGSELINPREVYGWGKENLPKGGRTYDEPKMPPAPAPAPAGKDKTSMLEDRLPILASSFDFVPDGSGGNVVNNTASSARIQRLTVRVAEASAEAVANGLKSALKESLAAV